MQQNVYSTYFMEFTHGIQVRHGTGCHSELYRKTDTCNSAFFATIARKRAERTGLALCDNGKGVTPVAFGSTPIHL